MKVLICGSRDWGDEDAIADRLADLAPDYPTIIHGACSRIKDDEERSADMLADRVARIYGYAIKPFPADWKRWGKRAGFIRNVEMADEKPDMAIAFQRNESPGTQHMIDICRSRGIPVEVITA